MLKDTVERVNEIKNSNIYKLFLKKNNKKFRDNDVLDNAYIKFNDFKK